MQKSSKENALIKKIQKTSEIKFSNKVESILFLDEIQNIISYTENEIFLLNMRDFSYESTVKSDKPILLLNLMKDKKTIIVSHKNSLSKLIIKKNLMTLEKYIDNILVNELGIVIYFHNQIVTSNKHHIYFYSEKEEIESFNIFSQIFLDEYVSFDIDIKVMSFLEYDENTLLFIYIFTEINSYEYYGNDYARISLYRKGEDNIKYRDFEELILENDYINFKIYKYKVNEVIIFGKTKILIFNIINWNYKTLFNSPDYNIIDNGYFLDNSYILLFLVEIKYDRKCLKYKSNDFSDGDRKNYLLSFNIEKINSIDKPFMISGNNENFLYNSQSLDSNIFKNLVSLKDNKISFYQLKYE